MPLLFLLLALAVLAAAGALASGRGDSLPAAAADRVPLGLPEGRLEPADLDALRFSAGFRGYRMDQVDAVLDRLRDELAARDARLTELTARDPGPAELAARDPGPAELAARDPAPGEPVLPARVTDEQPASLVEGE